MFRLFWFLTHSFPSICPDHRILMLMPPPPRAYIQSMNVCKNAGFGHVIIILFTFFIHKHMYCVLWWLLTTDCCSFYHFWLFCFHFQQLIQKKAYYHAALLIFYYYFTLLYNVCTYYWLECKTEAGWLRHQINRFRARNFCFIKTKKWNAKQIIIIVKIYSQTHTQQNTGQESEKRVKRLTGVLL